MSNVRKFSQPMLIRTKFSPPRLTRPPVQRDAALDALGAGLTRALTVIKAPAGFGKTTLLTTWREQLAAKDMIAAWLTLDQDDNDENRFAEYLTEALVSTLGSRAAGTPELDNTGKIVSVRVQLTSIINVIDKLGCEIVLMLDDYDKIVDPAVHELLAFLLRHTPANLHVVVACRADPPLPLASLRARDQMVEIDTEAMRFAVEDTQAFFAKSISVALSPDETRAIHDATEGWVAGLQIATLAMPGRTSMNGLIASFPRHSRALNDYLVENVLTQIPSDTVDFMLRTAILDRLNGALCERLTGAPDAAHKLEWLVSQNMFLQPLDEDGQWYRYHGLFADFLRTQLKKHLSDDCAPLHLRAAEWFSEHALWAEAVRHALDAERVDLAAEWLECCALDELSNSRVRTFLGWIQRLSPEALEQRPSLRIALIWALILTVQTEKAHALVDEVDAQLRDDPSPESLALRAVLRAQRISILSMQDRVSMALALGKQVWRERFPENLKPAHGFDWVDEAFLNVMLHLYRKEGYLDEARYVGEFYRVNPDPTQSLFMHSYRACLFASLEIQEGQIRAAAQRLEAALAVCEAHVGRRSAAATLIAASLASIYYGWNRFDDVEELLADRFDIIDDVCFIEPIQSAYISLARVRIAQEQPEAAQAILDRAETLAERRQWPRLTAACTAERIRIHLRGDSLSAAQRMLGKLDAIAAQTASTEPDSVDVEMMRLTAKARLQLHTGEIERAERELEVALALMANRKAATPYELAQLRVLLALAQHAAGKTDAAQSNLSEVLTLTSNNGTVRLLVDEGDALAALLQTLAATEHATPTGADYQRRISQALGSASNASDEALPFNTSVEAHHSRLLDGLFNDGTLSRRESDILELIGQKMSNKQIAKQLFVTPETVKWHLKNIYRKLGVSDRRLAALKAGTSQLVV